MRNRAKCKLCQDIIESYHPTDMVICKCAHIYVDGGEAMKCGAGKWENFLRVDDLGNEIIPIIKEKGEDVKPLYTEEKPDKEGLLMMLSEMIKSIERLPDGAMTTYITHYDFYSLLVLLAALFKED